MTIDEAICTIECLIDIEADVNEDNGNIDALEASLALLKERREKYKKEVRSKFYDRFEDLAYNICADLGQEYPILQGNIDPYQVLEQDKYVAELADIEAEMLVQNLDAKPKSYYDEILRTQSKKEVGSNG